MSTVDTVAEAVHVTGLFVPAYNGSPPTGRGRVIAKCGEMVKPGGIMFVATINRTLKALGLAIIGAEYVLRWLPRGTHQYGKLVRPDELEKALSGAGMAIVDRRHCRPRQTNAEVVTQLDDSSVVDYFCRGVRRIAVSSEGRSD